MFGEGMKFDMEKKFPFIFSSERDLPFLSQKTKLKVLVTKILNL